jgi:hypothetical protein
MSRLASRAEIAKLARTLGIEDSRLRFLEAIPALEIRSLREAAADALSDADHGSLRRLAALVRWLPARAVAYLAEHRFGALVTAHVAGEMPARRVTRIIHFVSTPFLADVCMHVDPRRARDLIRQQPVERMIAVALELVRRGEFLTLGSFVDVASDHVIAAVESAIGDEESLLRAAFFVQSKNRLDHLVRLMPRERVRRAILLAVDESRDLMPEVASLIVQVSYSLKQELGDLATEQSDAVLERIVRFAHAEDLWDEMLPVIAVLSVEVQRRFLNLPLLKEEPRFIESALRATDEHDFWGIALSFVHLMDDPIRTLVAEVAASQPRAAMERAANAALMGEHWDALLDMAARMPAAKQRELAEIVECYGEVDPDLVLRVRGQAERHGLAGAFMGTL